MKNVKLAALIVLGGAVVTTSAFAFREQARAANGQNCHMEETASISFNYTGNATDLKNIKPDVDKQMVDLKKMADDAHVESFEVQNYNYSVSVNNNGAVNCRALDELKSVNGAAVPASTASYQYNASFNYNVKPVDKALDLASTLTAKGYNISINVNSYKQCQ